jgi:Cof subfamily protein (haloacid dehalogenase superfamily)
VNQQIRPQNQVTLSDGTLVVRPQYPIRLVAVDLDGTLLNDSKQVSERTAGALRCLPARGVKVVIASARPPRSVRHIYQALRLDTLTINYNGALIWDEPRQAPVFHRPLPRGAPKRIIEDARELFPDVQVTCEILDKWYTDRFDAAHVTETGRLFKPDVIAPLKSFCGGQITKLMLLGDPPVVTQLASELSAAYAKQVTVLRTDDDLLQIMDRRVSKSVALNIVARHYGIRKREIMAIGDAPNDVGMLQMSGVAIAMNNAHRLVKETADWVAPSNNDHGVHAALVRYGLCE